MTKQELLRKDAAGEALTVSEVIAIQKIEKPIKHTYGKYGNLAKIYLWNCQEKCSRKSPKFDKLC